MRGCWASFEKGLTTIILGAPHVPSLSCRRWQGVALAVWGAAASLTARGCPDGTLECYRLLSSFLRVPALCDLALATPAGRSTVLQVYESMPSVSEWTGAGLHPPPNL